MKKSNIRVKIYHLKWTLLNCNLLWVEFCDVGVWYIELHCQKSCKKRTVVVSQGIEGKAIGQPSQLCHFLLESRWSGIAKVFRMEMSSKHVPWVQKGFCLPHISCQPVRGFTDPLHCNKTIFRNILHWTVWASQLCHILVESRGRTDEIFPGWRLN